MTADLFMQRAADIGGPDQTLRPHPQRSAADHLERGRMIRANRPDVRNPVLALPAAAQIQALPPEAREALRAVLLDLSRDARGRASESWRRHKAPMAAYWKAVAVYARHCAAAARQPERKGVT
jgi:hypothetical protein